MKKLIAILLALMIALSLAACSGNNSPKENLHMKKVIRFILYLGEIIFCFLGIFNFTQYWGYIGDALMKTDFSHATSLVNEIQSSFGADPPFETFMEIFIWLFFVALAANVILSVIGLIKTTLKIPKKISIAVNALPVVFFVVISIIALSYHDISLTTKYIVYSYEINALFIVFSIILIVNFILLFVPFPESTKNSPTSVHTQDVSESLTQYKDLLDKGIITQEEFDAKKKQILDL